MLKNKNTYTLILLGVIAGIVTCYQIPATLCTPISEDAQNFIYSSYFGGSDKDMILNVAFDSQGNIIVVGGTFSTDLNASGGFQPEYAGGSTDDIHINGGDGFVFKFSPEGNQIWGTYLGGSSLDACNHLVIDDDDNIFVTGDTRSTNFPVTEDAKQVTFGGGTQDVFITKLAPNGTVQYSSYIGGPGDDSGGACALDDIDQIHIAMSSTSSSLTTTSDAYQSTYGGTLDIYLSVWTNNLSERLYGSYFGGSDAEICYSIDIDSDGGIILAGNIMGENLPVLNAFKDEYSGETRDIFVAKFYSNKSLAFSTYLGGNGFDDPFGLTIGSNNDVVVSGRTWSTDYPVSDAIQKKMGGFVDGVITAFSADGQELSYSSYFGGTGWDTILKVTTGENGKIFACGIAGANFPLKNEYNSQNVTTNNLVLMQLSEHYEIEMSTYFGANSDDTTPFGIDYHSGSIVIAGHTRSSSLFISEDAYQPEMGDSDEGSIIIIEIENYLTGKDLSGNPSNLPTMSIAGYNIFTLGICSIILPIIAVFNMKKKYCGI
ncbi:SBBP repeat-containing protein [Candidatus Lokiarchaeum ossiferum]|uniref:SBBP repeat-containing protein n=1 Tax=Candidatus Lokiarchaeum ossiferum TaxID=2951803 RepID=UPI00352E1C63